VEEHAPHTVEVTGAGVILSYVFGIRPSCARNKLKLLRLSKSFNGLQLHYAWKCKSKDTGHQFF